MQFSAGTGLPYAILLLGIRRGILADRHLTERRERPAMMAIGLVSVTTGLLITWWLGAPRALFALVAAMVAGVVVSLAITVFWKISIHAAETAGTVAVLVLEFGPALWGSRSPSSRPSPGRASPSATTPPVKSPRAPSSASVSPRP
jgi:hypothetical protein